MNVELIPVVELRFYSDAIPWPEKGPYWCYAEAWGQYQQRSLAHAGLNPQMQAIEKGSELYRVSAVPLDNLPDHCGLAGFNRRV